MAIRPTHVQGAALRSVEGFRSDLAYLKSPFVLVVNPALPINSVPDLIEYVKERPGQIGFSSSVDRWRAASIGRIPQAALRHAT